MNDFDYPLLLDPIPVPKVWAGGQMARIAGRGGAAASGDIGESWDVSTWPTAPDDPSLSTVTMIRNGRLAGTPLDEVAEVPVVVKVIDSGAALSVQNHPNREDAHKNEMWYILEATNDAYLYMGFADGVTPEDFCALLRAEPKDEDRIMGALKCHASLIRGRHFHVPAPTVHALGPGLLTFEISERSQVTYRLFDYNRERSRGKLDIEPGCEAILAPKVERPPLRPELDIRGADQTDVISAFSTFCVVKAKGSTITVAGASRPHLVTASRGDVRLSGPTPDWDVSLGYTFTCLVPAIETPYTIDTQGSNEVLISPLNSPASGS